MVCAFLFLLVKHFLEKDFFEIIWFGYQIISSFFCCHKPNILMSSYAFHGSIEN